MEGPALVVLPPANVAGDLAADPRPGGIVVRRDPNLGPSEVNASGGESSNGSGWSTLVVVKVAVIKHQ